MNAESESFSPESYLKTSCFNNFEILRKLENENNQNFIFRSRGRKYVLRKSKEITEGEETLRNERKILKFLEEKEIESAPRSVIFDKEEEVHVISHVGDQSVKVNELSEEELCRWIKQLAEIHSLSFSQFKAFCEEKNYIYEEPENPRQNLNRLTRWLKTLEEKSKHTELVEFVEQKLKEAEEKEEQLSEDWGEAFLTHSDIVDSTRRTGKDFFFIDWEFARFNYRPFTDLGIIFTRHDLTDEQISLVKKVYRNELGVSEGFQESLNHVKKVRHIFEIIWCLERIQRIEGSEEQRYVEYARFHKEKISEQV